MVSKFRLLLLASFMAVAAVQGVHAEDEPQILAGDGSVAAPAGAADVRPGVSRDELDSELSRVSSELRSQRDLANLRFETLESEIGTSSSYMERILFAFLVAGGVVVFVVLFTINKHASVHEEKMRNMISESERALADLHRILDRPEAEHFHVSRKMSRIMNKMRETDNMNLPQKDIGDIYAASEDPTLPVMLHLQANALRAEQGGNWAEAIQIWERLLEIDDSNPEVLLHLAQDCKRLADVNSGDTSDKLRGVSLEYFHRYTQRTNVHLHSEQELRKMMTLKHNPLLQRDSSRVATVASFEQRTPPVQAEQAPAARPAAPVEEARTLSYQEYLAMKDEPEPKKVVKHHSITKSLLSNPKPFAGKQPVKAAMKKQDPNEDEREEDSATREQVPEQAQTPEPEREEETVAEAAVAAEETPAAAQDAVAEETAAEEPEAVKEEEAAQERQEEPEQEAVAEPEQKEAVEEAAPVQEQAVEDEPPVEVAQAKPEPEKSEAKATKPAKPALKKRAQPTKPGMALGPKKKMAVQKSKQSAAQKAKGKSAQNGKGSSNGASGFSDEEKQVAYKSRMNKADEYFKRFSEARRDRQQWLHAMVDEYEVAERYSQNVDLYRRWGDTLLRISELEGYNSNNVGRLLDVMKRGEEIFEGEFCTEIALCYAIFDDEANCRDMLDRAVKLTSLNSEIFAEHPEFDKYRQRPWYHDLVTTATS